MTVLNADEVRLTRLTDAPSGWDVIVLAKLAEWERTPLVSDAEFDAPTSASMAAARAVAIARRDAGKPPPTRIGADGSGGIALETVDGRVITQRIELSDAGRVDLYEFAPDGKSGRAPPKLRRGFELVGKGVTVGG